MLRRMQTMTAVETANELVSGTFLACPDFATGDTGSPVCEECGWLDTEHEQAGAEVHALPTRRLTRATPKRLAS